ncbi:MAG: hypothetical protein RMK78_08925 [Thermaurantiacus sp.]|uniref:hypothetical protein n=1 Tax=Thermaurantiacus sp. TaxID=2820283 RepID=UPI00298F0E73|nr:hypothetical protein [Thermaurantiacus sp.]MDW8415574.1 hypothetical protein [Thermaurantiacus sp.]
MPVQLALSVVALAIILAKVVQFARVRVWRRSFVDGVAALMHQGEFAQAAAALEREIGPVAAVMKAAAGRSAGVADALVREEVERIAQAHLDSLNGGCRNWASSPPSARCSGSWER